MDKREPRRIQLSRRKGWRMPENTVKVDRSTRLGNPWAVGQPGIPDATEAVRRFRAAVIGFEANGTWCKPQAHPDSYIGWIIANVPLLRGKNIACWCALDAPCHGDVYLELANRPICEEVGHG